MLAPGGSDICHLYPIPCYFEETNQNRYSKKYVKRQTKNCFLTTYTSPYILSCKKCICQEIILGDCIKKLGRFGMKRRLPGFVRGTCFEKRSPTGGIPGWNHTLMRIGVVHFSIALPEQGQKAHQNRVSLLILCTATEEDTAYHDTIHWNNLM